MSEKIRYIGVDPNKLLPPVYKQMIEFFMPNKDRSRYTMIESTIQDAKLPNEKVDLIFTSPPYFKIEQYQNNGEVKDSNEEEWFNNFLAILITKTCAQLNMGGHLVLVINQMPGEHYIQRMIDYVYEMGDMHYLGIISYSNKALRNPQPMFIWEKSKTVPVDLYNPKMVITQHVVQSTDKKEIKFSVFRDDLLRGGTKQRALVPLLNSVKKQKFIYASPQQGFAQIALAYAAKLTHKTAVVFLMKPRIPHYRHNATKLALSHGNIKLCEIPNGHLKLLQEKSEEYHAKNPDSYLMAFGGGSELYKKELEKSLKSAIPKTVKPARIWVSAGSATVLDVLYNIFPKSEFCVVQVGKKVWPDQLQLKRTTLYVSDENYVDDAKIRPPYPANGHYEAKLWKYFLLYGKSGDYIFNVAGDPPDLENHQKKNNQMLRSLRPNHKFNHSGKGKGKGKGYNRGKGNNRGKGKGNNRERTTINSAKW
jgi:hypothetical protein